MPYCPICERKFDTKHGLQGHFRFKHKYELGQDRPAKETPMTRAIKRNIDRRISGDTMMKAIEEEKRDKQLDSGMSREKTEYVPKKALVLEESLRDYPKEDVFEGVDLGGVEIEYGRRKKPTSWG